MFDFFQMLPKLSQTFHTTLRIKIMYVKYKLEKTS